MIKIISNLGDAAVYCDFGKEVNKEINTNVIKYFYSIRNQKIKGINNLTPSYNKLIISFDLKITNFNEIKKKIENLNINEVFIQHNKELKIPVCCDEIFGLDISILEKKLSIKKDKF